MHEGELLDFDYLMVVKGTRRLKKPNVSSSFVWNGQDVASLAGQGSLYILAKSELLPQDTNERDEECGQIANDDISTPGSPLELSNSQQCPRNESEIHIHVAEAPVSTPQYRFVRCW